MAHQTDPDFKRVIRHHGNLHHMECGHVAGGPSCDSHIICLLCWNQREADERAERKRIIEEAGERAQLAVAALT